MILIGLGSNVAGPWGSPRQTLEMALKALGQKPCSVVKSSTIITSKPFGLTDQPDFVNAVAQIKTELSPEMLMSHLHDLELLADRRRTVRWGPRTLDLDLLDYDGLIQNGDGPSRGHQTSLFLPHPGIAERTFVLIPLAEIAPNWKHPVLKETAQSLLRKVE